MLEAKNKKFWVTPGAIGMLRGTVEQPQGCAHTATHTFCVQKCPLSPLKSLQHSQQLQAWTSAALDEVQELVTVPQLCCGRCISFHVPALSHSFFSVYICSDLRSKWWEGTGSWSACVLRAGSVDKKCVKEVSYPPTHNQGRDLISCFVFFFFPLAQNLPLWWNIFALDWSLSPLLCVCVSMWPGPFSVYSAAEKCNDFWAGCPKINLACGES